MDDLELKQTLERLEEQQQKIIEQLATSSSASSKRDFWDKLAAISPIISGVAIALSALLCTYQYNQQQIKLQEAQTVEKFIPHLMGNDTSKRMAILAMKTLVNTDLAAKYAAMFPSQGTLSALKTIAKNGSIQDKKIVSKTYTEIEENEKINSKSDGIEIKDNDNPSATEASLTPEPATHSVVDLDTAGDTIPTEKPIKDLPVKEGKEHSPTAEDKESREDSLPKRELETRQPHLERIRSNAMKDEVPTSL